MKLKAAYLQYLELSIKARILILLATIVVLLYFVACSIKGGDFASYLEASLKMLNGINIYAPPHIHLRYSYSPFWAMVLIPLALFPSYIGVFVWLVINVFLLYRTIILLRIEFGVRFSDKKRDVILWSMILLFMSRFIELNFHHAQMTIFLLWSILESLRLINQEKKISAGILIGTGIIIKIMPVVMIPYFIYRKEIKAALVSIITVVVTFFLPIIYLGKERFMDVNQTWFQILRPDSSEFQMDNTGDFPHNLSALLYRLFTNTGAPYLKNIFSMDYDTATKCVWAIMTLLILLTIYFLSTLPFKKIKSKSHQLYEISYITLIMPLIFPHQMKYAFYFILPAICCLTMVLIDKFINSDRDWVFVVTGVLVFVCFILCTATTDLILGMHYSVITQYFKTITIGTLLLIPALALNKRFFVKD